MKRLATSLIFFMSLNLSHGQDQHVIDSVMSLIKNDDSRIDMEIFFELGFQHANLNHSSSIDYFGKGLSIAKRLRNSFMIVKCSRLKAHVLQLDGKQEEAVIMLTSILPIARRLRFTREREANKSAPERAYPEQDEILPKTARSIKSALATQKGLHTTIMNSERLSPETVGMQDCLEEELRWLTRHLIKNSPNDRLNDNL